MPGKQKKKRKAHSPSGGSRQAQPQPRVPVAERLLLTAIEEVALDAQRIVASTLGEAQAAAALAQRIPAARIILTTLDAHRAARLAEQHAGLTNLELRCEPDLAYRDFDGAAADEPSEADAVLMPSAKNAEAELTREWLDQAHVALRRHGKLLISTDNPHDRWLHGELRKRFDKVSKRPTDEGVVYVCVKSSPLPRPKTEVWGEFSLHYRGRELRLFSRPGVFAHRRLDPGAKALLAALEQELASSSPARLLDIGTGCGSVALAAACSEEELEVHAIDANPRAIQCTRRGAEHNGVAERVRAELVTAEAFAPETAFGMAVANPPYYSGYRIAAAFAECAQRALHRGGTLLLVTKATDWYQRELPRRFASVIPRRFGSYTVFVART